ncbi:MAG: TIR domain-containing protein, partial [Anaerolineae bacterium]
MPPSADWLAEVYRAIEGADTLVFIVSQTSVHSDVCRREIEHGLRNHKRLVPVLLHDIDPKILPPEIAALNWVFFREQDDFQQAFDKLVQAIQTDLEWVRAHTRLLVRAAEWDSKGRDNSFALRGRDLQEAEEWLGKSATKEPTPTPLQVEYILASRKAATSRQRTTLALVTLGLVVATVLALAAWKQRNEALEAKVIAVQEAKARATAQAEAIAQRDHAEQQRRIALSRQLAAQAQTYLADQLDLALLLAVEASRIADTVEARASLLDALEYSPNLAAFLHGHTSYVFSVAFHPQGNILASGSADGSIMLWDTEHPE